MTRTDSKREPGIYSADGDFVHHYQGGAYRLGDIPAYFELGRLETGEGRGETQLVLDAREIHLLKTMADAYSFDYEEGFIEMCLEIHRFAATLPHKSFCFTANF